MADRYEIPGIDQESAKRLVEGLQDRLDSLNDLHLTLKHIHWNVTGPNFIAVHEMLDPQTEAVRTMADDVAERIATLGGEPQGTPGGLVARRSWEDYRLGRAPSREHLEALDRVYTGVIADHRELVDETEKLDLPTQDMLIGQVEKLELYQWFVRAHLDGDDG